MLAVSLLEVLSDSDGLDDSVMVFGVGVGVELASVPLPPTPPWRFARLTILVAMAALSL